MTFPLTSAFFKKSGGGSCPSYTPGLYTAEEIDDLVNVDGYIPVASADEFDAIRTGVSETMGAGTCWEGTYTTGMSNKKYIQVTDIDFGAFGTWTSMLDLRVNSVYDGNNLSIFNLTSSAQGLFNSFSQIAYYYNIRVTGTISATFGNVGGIISGIGEGEVDNCQFNGSVTTTGSNSAGILGICNVSGGIVTNCVNNGSVTAAGSISGIVSITSASTTIQSCVNNGIIDGVNLAGGICGTLSSGGSVSRCINNADVSSTNNVGASGGIVGQQTSSTIEQCENNGIIEGSRASGIVGTSITSGTISDCVNNGALVGILLGRVSGIVGQVNNDLTINNSYNIADFSGVLTAAGAINNARFFAGATTVNNSYFDTTVGYPTSVGGTGQTTSALQTPTSNTGIYSAWSAAIWDFGTATDYPSLTTVP